MRRFIYLWMSAIVLKPRRRSLLFYGRRPELRQNAAALYGKTGAIPGVHLLLYQDSRPLPVRSGDAELLRCYAANRASDGGVSRKERTDWAHGRYGPLE